MANNNISDINIAELYFKRLMGNNEIETRKLQKSLGYIFTEYTDNQRGFAFVGKRSSGKSSVCKLLAKTLDKFCYTTTYETFSKNPGHVKMNLMGKRLLQIMEPTDTSLLNEDIILNLINGEKIQVKKANKRNVIFKPICKIILEIHDWERFKLLYPLLSEKLIVFNFQVKFTNSPVSNEIKANPKLFNKLFDNHGNIIFIWITKGTSEWLKNKDLLSL